MKGNERADIFVFATIFDEADKSRPSEKEVRRYGGKFEKIGEAGLTQWETPRVRDTSSGRAVCLKNACSFRQHRVKGAVLPCGVWGETPQKQAQQGK
ncbi:hypothetical protein L6R29_24330 [Myxococcota bacterium]|nr:hypothetical protein [Myxococcota bacterium]